MRLVAGLIGVVHARSLSLVCTHLYLLERQWPFRGWMLLAAEYSLEQTLLVNANFFLLFPTGPVIVGDCQSGL